MIHHVKNVGICLASTQKQAEILIKIKNASTPTIKRVYEMQLKKLQLNSNKLVRMSN